MLPCNTSDPRQQWTLVDSNNAISPKFNAEKCITRGAWSKPLTVEECRGRAGSLDPSQQWKLDAGTAFINDVPAQGSAGGDCIDISTSTTSGSNTVLHVQHPCRRGINEHFGYEKTHGWLFSNCSGSNCLANHSTPKPLQPVYCATMQSQGLDAPSPGPAGANCIPWSIDKTEHRKGFYYDGGIGALLLTSNETLVAFFSAEKYTHKDDNNHCDLVLRRSFDQGLTWQPFQLVFSPSTFFAPAVFPAEAAVVLDRDTGTIWALIGVNSTFLVVMSSGDHGASWTTPRDITNVTKPKGYGWIAPIATGVQLSSGRLVVCTDHIYGQWSAYPIDHSISSVIYSDGEWASSFVPCLLVRLIKLLGALVLFSVPSRPNYRSRRLVALGRARFSRRRRDE
jgi:hypothetical protein